MNSPNYFKIGMFILISISLGIAGLVAFGAGAYFQTPQQMETYIDESVQGLSIGSPVKNRGVEIGTVSEITFVRNEYLAKERQIPHFDLGKYVLVRWDLKPGILQDQSIRASHPFIQNAVEKGLRVRLASQGITGLAYLELDWLAHSEASSIPEISWTPKTCYVPSTKSTFNQVFSVVSDILADVREADIGEIGLRVQKLLEIFNSKFGGVDVARLQDDVSLLLNDIRATSEKLRMVVDDPAIRKALDRGAGSLDTLGTMLDESRPEIEKILTHVGRISEDLADTSTDLPETIRRLNRNLQRLDRMISDNESRFTLLIENLTQASRDLKVFLGNAREYPAQVFFGDPPPPVEPGSGRGAPSEK